ncbi:RNA polymerase II subunit A C-terminal domain phosphatase SSU72-like isoform X2 [Varroa jacobsoni]|uniref:RNA polymerase II subunit A C-terminal domain phosphatase SSU72 n=1 Tax=Varroa destructor TaxID=109461 RepID=A0A7M7M4L5_VARDE|nr:RNA polymerase II subunit A C-terminal domain phosphatase SSU72-like isoform X2 [Varroa destructor]XP_022703492.1 RNA polymerase II subunit A C-terminal domain phosphatase SSU72-like isoform X2 [Varroa jacobsoni]
MPSNIRFAVVCSSNQNRSMETHLFLSKRGFKVRSFGTGDKVKLPGNAPDKPNVYDFGTPYETMYQDLMRKDKNLYTNNGILNMLDRNKRIKRAPEKFQLSSEIFDVIFTVEERVYDQVVEEFSRRTIEHNSPVHVINIDVLDNHEEATLGAFMFCDLAQQMAESDDLDNDIDELLQEFESKKSRTILHSIQFY